MKLTSQQNEFLVQVLEARKSPGIKVLKYQKGMGASVAISTIPNVKVGVLNIHSSRYLKDELKIKDVFVHIDGKIYREDVILDNVPVDGVKYDPISRASVVIIESQLYHPEHEIDHTEDQSLSKKHA